MKIPNPLEQHGSGHHATCVLHENFQELKLSRLQFDHAIAASHHALQAIECEISDDKQGRRLLERRAARQRMRTRAELCK